MNFVVLLGCSAALLLGQDVDAGRKLFESTCGRCHGADGRGGEMGPPIRARLGDYDDEHLTSLIHTGLPGRGMPPSTVSATEMPQLIAFLRTLQPRAGREEPLVRMKLQTT
jgi:mono/diheme cytochrome c family protein